MKKLLIAVLVFSVSLTATYCFAEQKIVVCSESYRILGINYAHESPSSGFSVICEDVCATSVIEDYLKDGWKIDTNMPTRFMPDISEERADEVAKDVRRRAVLYGDGGGVTGRGVLLFAAKSCECIGTKYVLSRAEKKVEVAPPDKNLELLKKEIELLKKENDMLKKDGDALKQENEVLKKAAKKKR